MDHTRIGRVLTAYADEPLLPEVLLLKSIYSPQTPTRTNDRLTDLIIGAISNNIPVDLTYNNEFAGFTDEHAWCHSKLAGLPMPTLDPVHLATLSNYDFTHHILWATDFSRSPITDNDALNQLTTKILIELDLDLLAEYHLCRLALNQSVLLGDLSTVLNWFDNTWDGTKHHTAMVTATLLARMG